MAWLVVTQSLSWQRFPDVLNELGAPYDACPFLPQPCAALREGRMRGRLQDLWKANKPKLECPFGGAAAAVRRAACGWLCPPPGPPATAPRPARAWKAEALTFSYLAKPPMTAGSTIPFRSMDSGLMGRLSSLWYWFIIIRIFSLAVDMVSMAFSRGLMVVC